jgi:hypothetical protein
MLELNVPNGRVWKLQLYDKYLNASYIPPKILKSACPTAGPGGEINKSATLSLFFPEKCLDSPQN